MKTKISKVQDAIFKQIERLDDNDNMKKNAKEELKRANAINSSAVAYVKSVGLQLSIVNTSAKLGVDIDDLTDALGVSNEPKTK